MSKKITIDDISNYKLIKTKHKAFALKFKDREFAIYYANSLGCTLTWESTVNIEEIDSEILSLLSCNSISSNQQLVKQYLTQSIPTQVRIVLPEQNKIDIFDLKSLSQYQDFRNSLKQSNKIRLVRFDVSINSEYNNNFSYSFTFENPDYSLDDNPDIYKPSNKFAIRIPWVFPAFINPNPFPDCSSEMLLRPKFIYERILARHKHRVFFEQGLDFSETTKDINLLVEDTAEEYYKSSRRYPQFYPDKDESIRIGELNLIPEKILIGNRVSCLEYSY